MALERIEACPLCNNPAFEPFLVCKDYTSSLEHFSLVRCSSCSFVFLNPRPDAVSLPAYYESREYISHSRKPTGPIDLIYLFARNFTLRWKTRLIKKYKSKISILDFGCGTGGFLRACQRQGWQISGVEPSEKARHYAKELTGASIERDLAPFQRRQFDVISLWHVLEHVPDLRKKVAEIKAVLKDDGIIFIAVPNHESNDALRYQAYWAGYDVPRHLWHFTKTTMTALLTAEGFKMRAIIPMKLDAYYVSLLSEKYKSSNHLTIGGMIKATSFGFTSNRRARSTMNYSSLIYIAGK